MKSFIIILIISSIYLINVHSKTARLTELSTENTNSINTTKTYPVCNFICMKITNTGIIVKDCLCREKHTCRRLYQTRENDVLWIHYGCLDVQHETTCPDTSIFEY
jgi:hypothetical protein